MSILKLYVRSFHPLSNFGVGGLGFHGDNRGFSHDPGVTARIYSISRIDLRNATVAMEAVESGTSSHLVGILSQDYSDPATKPKFTLFGGTVDPYREDGDQGAQLALAYTGQNFAMPLASNDTVRENLWEHAVPGLDVMATLNLEIDRDDDRMSVAFRMVGDGISQCRSLPAGLRFGTAHAGHPPAYRVGVASTARKPADRNGLDRFRGGDFVG